VPEGIPGKHQPLDEHFIQGHMGYFFDDPGIRIHQDGRHRAFLLGIERFAESWGFLFHLKGVAGGLQNPVLAANGKNGDGGKLGFRY